MITVNICKGWMVKSERDESYFGGIRKGKRGRGAVGKIPVLGLLTRNGMVYTVIIPNAQSNVLMPIIREKVAPNCIVYTDTFKSYNALEVSNDPCQILRHQVPLL